MMAAREGRERVAGILLERGADPAVINDRGEDALHWAMRHDNARIAR
jgi:ankyrin repeat protein